jgi:hypothetical protein
MGFSGSHTIRATTVITKYRGVHDLLVLRREWKSPPHQQ